MYVCGRFFKIGQKSYVFIHTFWNIHPEVKMDTIFGIYGPFPLIWDPIWLPTDKIEKKLYIASCWNERFLRILLQDNYKESTKTNMIFRLTSPKIGNLGARWKKEKINAPLPEAINLVLLKFSHGLIVVHRLLRYRVAKLYWSSNRFLWNFMNFVSDRVSNEMKSLSVDYKNGIQSNLRLNEWMKNVRFCLEHWLISVKALLPQGLLLAISNQV